VKRGENQSREVEGARRWRRRVVEEVSMMVDGTFPTVCFNG
jgi:hypothetical protein